MHFRMDDMVLDDLFLARRKDGHPLACIWPAFREIAGLLDIAFRAADAFDPRVRAMTRRLSPPAGAFLSIKLLNQIN